MDRTFAIACESPPVGRAKMAASLVYSNYIYQTKSNVTKTHPFQKKYSCNEDAIFMHAENHCIISALRTGFSIDKLSYSSLYIARAKRIAVGSDFHYGEAKPCKGCQRSIADFGIRNVFYTTETGIECL